MDSNFEVKLIVSLQISFFTNNAIVCTVTLRFGSENNRNWIGHRGGQKKKKALSPWTCI